MIEDNILENTSSSLSQITETVSMISILICDDDPTMLAKINIAIQSIVVSQKIKAKIYTFEDASKICCIRRSPAAAGAVVNGSSAVTAAAV